MKAKELAAIAKVMRANGIVYFKTDTCVLKMAHALPAEKRSKRIKQAAPLTSLPTDPNPIEHKLEELSSLMKLSDTDLVDKLFPDHTQEEQESA